MPEEEGDGQVDYQYIKYDDDGNKFGCIDIEEEDGQFSVDCFPIQIDQ